jgi:AmmeMemoRadiSam system protein A
MSLSEQERRELLGLARQAILAAVHHTPPPETSHISSTLLRPCGAFVTLHERGRLRGCIGQVESSEPLTDTVVHCAAAAAMEDPRFAPVRAEEIVSLEIEISVLSPPAPVRPEEIEIGRHGLIVSRGRMRGLLLPQVATQFRWSRERFLQETCRKAGLEPAAWQDPAVRIEAFTAEVFSEADSSAGRHAQASD